jgi:hypothetical protein
VTIPTARALLHRAAYELATAASRSPAIALRTARHWGVGVPVDDDTDIVIEGYPRSANTAAVEAFVAAQPAITRIAHHTHAPANVIAALRQGLPVIVLIRSPDEAVTEVALMRPELTLPEVMRGYRRFYRPLLPYREGLVVARSEEDLDDIVRRVNERFGTAFVVPSAGSPGGASNAETGERYWTNRRGGLPVLGRAEPTGDRDAMRRRIDTAYSSPRLASRRAELASLYERFVPTGTVTDL